MLCITFEYHTDKMIRYISDLLIKGNGFGDIFNSRDIFIKAIGPNETLKVKWSTKTGHRVRVFPVS
ncbi:hypothetical protein, partial [Shigella flexneri]|uniref:hypothetical protein n=1 Tax=Shigella flexneri TaxID=623 RepID=UPI0034A4432B